jgi:hypothetical protein
VAEVGDGGRVRQLGSMPQGVRLHAGVFAYINDKLTDPNQPNNRHLLVDTGERHGLDLCELCARVLIYIPDTEFESCHDECCLQVRRALAFPSTTVDLRDQGGLVQLRMPSEAKFFCESASYKQYVAHPVSQFGE